MTWRPPTRLSSPASTISRSVIVSGKWPRQARRTFKCSRWRRSRRTLGRGGRRPDCRVCLELGLRRHLVSGAALHIARASRWEHRQRADRTDSGSRREVRRFQQGSDHLCLQYRVAGALHPPRAVSAISDLQRQRAPRAFDRSPPWPAIQMRSARRRSLDVGSLRVIGRAGAWGVPREASPLSDQR
ncbi:hypothetical protein ABIB75_008059 [Bradyrhizobium sp. GM2.2]